jgi:hypothetical protein
VRRDPDNADAYASNYAAFEDRINELDTAIKATIDSIPPENRQLLTYHDSWAYFSPRYGTTVIGAIQPADFAEPSAREVADLITQLREAEAPAIFGSEVFPSPVLDQIAKEAGVTYVDTLRDDDLPGAPGDANHSYVGMMVENVRIMAEALGGDPRSSRRSTQATFPAMMLPSTRFRIKCFAAGVYKYKTASCGETSRFGWIASHLFVTTNCQTLNPTIDTENHGTPNRIV